MPHVEIVWQADGLELASNDEIEHHASIDTQTLGAASGQRMSVAVGAMQGTDSLASRVGSGGEGNERAKAHLVMDLVMNAL